MLSFRRHPPLPVPPAFLPFLGLIAELAEHSRWFTGLVPLLGRFVHFRPDDFPQSLVARQPEHEIHTVAFAPAHQWVTAEAGISAQNDPYCRPRLSKLPHDSLNFP